MPEHMGQGGECFECSQDDVKSSEDLLWSLHLVVRRHCMASSEVQEQRATVIAAIAKGLAAAICELERQLP
eukprot:4068687-Amphidinium_carterae.1